MDCRNQLNQIGWTPIGLVWLFKHFCSILNVMSFYRFFGIATRSNNIDMVRFGFKGLS